MGLCAISAGTTSQAYILGALDADAAKQILCFSFGGIGSVASGYLGSVLFPIKGMSFRQCWTINFICGFMLAPWATYKALKHYPDMPIPITATATSFLLGALGVKILQYVFPLALKFYARTIGLSPKKDRTDDKQDE
jgi:hypothetical protein